MEPYNQIYNQNFKPIVKEIIIIKAFKAVKLIIHTDTCDMLTT